MKVRIIGAGYAGVRAALDLDRRLQRRPDVKITLVDKRPYHQLVTESYRPAAGSTQSKALTIPLQHIFSDTRVRVMQGEVTQIKVAEGRFLLDGDKVLGFDRLIVAPGSQPEYFSIPGVEEHSLAIQGVNSADVVREHIEAMFSMARKTAHSGAAGGDADAAPLTEDERRAYLGVVVIGGGFTGVEFAGEFADRIPVLAQQFGFGPDEVRIVCIEAAADIMPGFEDPLVDAAVETLLSKGVSLEMGVPVARVEPGRVLLKDGRVIEARTVIWAGGVRAHPLVAAGFTTGARGRALVNEHLQSVDSPHVYVIGDSALAVDPTTGRYAPPTAQHAIEQGRLAARNVWADIVGLPLDAFRDRSFGVIATVGRDVGLTSLGGFQLAGRLPAVLKDAATLRYIYSLGGTRLLLKFMSKHWSALLFR